MYNKFALKKGLNKYYQQIQQTLQKFSTDKQPGKYLFPT